MNVQPLFVSIPHSGEKVPPVATWLHGLPEETLMCDVDRYVDFLYEPALLEQKIPYVKTEWHRYIADLNRLPDDVDQDSVIGSTNPSGKFSRGFHWVMTTYRERLMPQPITQDLHQYFVDLVYVPFHQKIREFYDSYKKQGFTKVYHLDVHSMPSLGTNEHRDPGQFRADIVISDCSGKSCDPEYRELVVRAYEQAGFKVVCNWPYLGGRVTEMYGNPQLGQQALQVEMNRALYMDEKTKKLLPEKAKLVQEKLKKALSLIQKELK
jgi:N-formylglutamate amidohydrolase